MSVTDFLNFPGQRYDANNVNCFENYETANIENDAILNENINNSQSDGCVDHMTLNNVEQSLAEPASHQNMHVNETDEQFEEHLEDDHVQGDQQREQITKDAIVHAIFETLDLVGNMNASLKNVDELLSMARTFYCRGAQLDAQDENNFKEWPKNWRDAKTCLNAMGYKDAKEYFVCLSSEHPCHWDILESKNDVCRHWRAWHNCLLLPWIGNKGKTLGV